MWHLFGQQYLLSCSERLRDCKAQLASHFKIRAMTQFVTFGKQLQLQLEDLEEEGRKTSSATAGYYQTEGTVAVSEGSSFILKKPQKECGCHSLYSPPPYARGEFESRNAYSQTHHSRL